MPPADQPSPALAEAREIVGKMTAKPFIGVVIEGDDTPPILFSHEDNVAGANRAVALFRTVVAEETVEAVAALYEPRLFERDEHGHWEESGASANARRETAKNFARAVLTALLERAREGT